MKPLERKVVNIFKSLVEKRTKVHRIVLFGSRARGDADPDSDMDVFVLVDDLTGELEDHISECAWEAGFEHGIVLVPVAYPYWLRAQVAHDTELAERVLGPSLKKIKPWSAYAAQQSASGDARTSHG